MLLGGLCGLLDNSSEATTPNVSRRSCCSWTAASSSEEVASFFSYKSPLPGSIDMANYRQLSAHVRLCGGK